MNQCFPRMMVQVIAGIFPGNSLWKEDSKMNSSINSRTLFQAALLQSLILGHYEGSVEVKELKGQGDFGIGTFDSLDGELIMCRGKVYQVNGRGEVKEAHDRWKVPFADVFFFETDRTLPLKGISSLNELREKADDLIQGWGPNYFYGIRIHGVFDKVYARSERAQQKPYRRLDEVMKKDQVEFNSTLTTPKAPSLAFTAPPSWTASTCRVTISTTSPMTGKKGATYLTCA